MNAFLDFLVHSPWGMYALALAAPFVQEDAAVFGAATASATGHGEPVGLFMATLVGLIVSDAWKYWLGRLANAHPWAARKAAHPSIAAVRERVINRPGLTLLVARFVPGTRIPLYIACGLFRVPFWRFLAMVAVSALIYVALAFILLATLGLVFGAQVRGVVPFVVAVMVVVMVAYNWISRRMARRRFAREPAGVQG